MHRHALISLAFVSVLSLSLLLPPDAAVGAPISCSSGLSGCHFNPSVTDGTGRNTPSGQFPGSHTKHSGSAAGQYAYACTHCHPSASYSNSHQTGYKNITGSSLPRASYTQGNKIPLSFQNAPTFGNCNSTFCHSDGKASPTYASPLWGGSAACGTCHRQENTNANMAAAGTPPALSAAHFKHVATDRYGLNTAYHCGSCHAETATNNTTVNIAGGKHVNSTRDWKFGTFAGINQAGGSYAASACTATYCHSKGVATVAPFTAPISNILWTAGAGSSTCTTTCHGGNTTAATIATNGPADKHSKHIATDAYNMTCDECHAETTAAASSTTLNATTGYTKHVNGTKDYKFSAAFRGTAYSEATGTYAGSGGSCTNTYCHSMGTRMTSNPTTYPYTGAGFAPYQTANWNGTLTNCNGCHGDATYTNGMPNYANGTPKANSHLKHVLFTCEKCHSLTTTNGTSVTGFTHHADANYDVSNAAGTISYAMGTIAANGIPAGGSCSTTYCHSKVQSTTGGARVAGDYQTVTWGGASMTCSSCHGNTVATLTTGSHATHLSTTTHATITCAGCHSGYENGNTVDHANSLIDVQQSAILGSTGTYTDAAGAPANGFGSCGTSYCHSNVQSASGGARVAGDYKTVAWGSGAMNCGSCHGNTDATLVTGTHAKHLNATYGYTCAACHGTTGGAGNTTIHANQTINIDLTTKGASATYSGDGTPGNSNFGTCIATICHGRNSGTWGTSVSTQLCTECHGQANTAYPNFSSSIIAPGGAGVDTGGNTADTSPRVGTHQTHLLASNTISDKVHCGECHTTHTTIQDSTHLNYTTSTISFGPLAKANAANPSITRSGGVITCSNIYCHGAKMPGGDATGSNKAPAFNATGYLPATLTTSACGVCHGFPPATGSGHPSVTAPGSFPTTSCGCHGNIRGTGNTYANIFVDKTKHINGIYEPASMGNCVGCHATRQGASPTLRAAVVDGSAGSEGDDFIRGSRHVSNGTTTQIVTNFDCIVCHAEGDTSSTSTDFKDTAYHGAGGSNKTVDLRDVDSANGATVKVAWPGTRLTATNGAFTATTTQRDNMDSFCMGCHDSNGASQLVVNNTNTGMLVGTTAVSGAANRGGVNPAFRPFNTNSNLTNMYDTNGTSTINSYRNTTYMKVLDVKSQFNSTNQTGTGWASHHNLNQFTKRYGSRNATAWPNAAWVSANTLEGQNMQTAGETAGLHCADCHLNESNAHGTRNTPWMLQAKDGTDTTYDSTMTAASGNHVCYKCHSNTVYATDGTATNSSRFTHAGGDDGHFGSSYGGKTAYIVCINCHGGYASGTARGMGAIHGTNETYGRGPSDSTYTTKRYRFMNGANGRYFQPSGTGVDANANGTWAVNWEGNPGDYGCYTNNTADAWSSCTSHSTYTKGVGATNKKNYINRQRMLSY